MALALPVLSLKTGMPSIKVVPPGDSSREGYTRSQKAFGRGSTGPLQIVAPSADAAQAAATARHDPGIARVLPSRPGGDGLVLVQAIPTTDPSARATGATIDRLRAALPPSALVGGAVAENHDLEAALSAKTPLVIGVVLGAQLPAAGRRAAGAADRRARRPHEPAGDRRCLRRREVDLPGRRRARAARLRAAGVPGRVGAGVLLRDDLRDLDGLHGVPAVYGEGALGPVGRRRQGGDGRRHGPLGTRDLRGRSGDGRGLLHVRAERPAAAEGDGRDPRRRRAARRRARPAAARAGDAAAARPLGRGTCRGRSAGCCPTSASATHDHRRHAPPTPGRASASPRAWGSRSARSCRSRPARACTPERRRRRRPRRGR